jgi:hypothetical protein
MSDNDFRSMPRPLAFVGFIRIPAEWYERLRVVPRAIETAVASRIPAAFA